MERETSGFFVAYIPNVYSQNFKSGHKFKAYKQEDYKRFNIRKRNISFSEFDFTLVGSDPMSAILFATSRANSVSGKTSVTNPRSQASTAVIFLPISKTSLA